MGDRPELPVLPALAGSQDVVVTEANRPFDTLTKIDILEIVSGKI